MKTTKITSLDDDLYPNETKTKPDNNTQTVKTIKVVFESEKCGEDFKTESGFLERLYAVGEIEKIPYCADQINFHKEQLGMDCGSIFIPRFGSRRHFDELVDAIKNQQQFCSQTLKPKNAYELVRLLALADFLGMESIYLDITRELYHKMEQIDTNDSSFDTFLFNFHTLAEEEISRVIDGFVTSPTQQPQKNQCPNQTDSI